MRRVWMIVGVLSAIWVAVFAYGVKTHQFDRATIFVQTETTRYSDYSSSVSSSTVPVASIETSSSTHATNAMVVRVIDGDTLEVLEDGQAKPATVRLLGVNTPETVDPRRPVQCYGKEASAFVHALLEGKRIDIRSDPQADERDAYGRLLRNVILEDGRDVNAMLVREGYAYAYLSFPLTPARKREMKQLEIDARTAQRGLWSPDTCNGKTQ